MKRLTYFCLLLALGLSSSLWAQMTLFGDLYIAPESEFYLADNDLYFDQGKILTDQGGQSGILSFAPDTTWENAHHTSYVDGFVRFYDRSQFTFPIGHNNVLQRLSVTEFVGAPHLDVAYQQNPHSHLASPEGVSRVSDTHFWELRSPNGYGRLTLEWNQFSALHQLLGNFNNSNDITDRISIGGFNGQEWEIIESKVVEVTNPSDPLMDGALQSTQIVDFSNYSAYALMALMPENVTVYQVITPTGDGKNDTWVIDGILDYPQAQVSVYNRWGQEVFSAKNGYNNNWRGNHNSSQEILPTGPYFYLIDLNSDGEIDQKGWLYITD